MGEWITHYVAGFGYTGILVGMALENMGIPLPSELILCFAGYLVFTAHLEFWSSILAAVIGGLLGSVLAYYIGAFGRERYLLRFTRGHRVFEHKLHLAENWFLRYGSVAVFTGRLLPVIRTYISFPAGMSRIGMNKFILYTLLGSIPWTVALLYAGVRLGPQWAKLVAIMHNISIVLIGSCVLAAAGYLLYRRLRATRSHGE